MSMLTQSIGRVLAGRYRIESVLGTGASAHVFAARDVELRRLVAIKLLHPALASDGGFLRRFRAEAQSAAALTHPHVLAVFDWGDDTSGPFLVLEFLGGGSLRGMLDEGRALSVAQAVAIGTQAAEGLAYAHGRGFVHRDVKPANLLFDEEGRLRVADFGLARALAEAAMTEPSGATVGTARYAAPEQALGHLVDGHADVYALALVLYEAVTGTVPFTADTTISTLMARVGARLPHDAALGPLGALLERAAAPEAGQRLDAPSLARHLSELSARLPAPEPLPLVGVGDGSGTGTPGSDARSALSGIDRTEHGVQPLTVRVPAAPGPPGVPAARVPLADADTHALDLASAVGVAAEPDGRHPTRPDVPAVPQEAVAGGPGGPGGPGGRWKAWLETPFVLRGGRALRKPVLIALAVALVLGVGAFAVSQSGLFVASHPVPDLTNLTRAQADAKLGADHFTLQVVGHRYSTTVASGGVVREIPAAGTSLDEGSKVSVVLSNGPPPVAVPSLSWITSGDCSAVTSALAASHLHPDCTYEHSPQVPKGGVIDWSPKGRVPEFSAVRVVISEGPVMVTVPSLTGLTCAAATSTLQAVGLGAKCVDTYSASAPNGQVIPGGWNPSDSAPQGSVVTVSISKGPPPVQVPAVTPGERVPQAVASLLAAGFLPGQVFGPIQGKVFATNPSFPASAPQGTTVDIYTR